MAAGDDVVELGSDADAVANLAHAAFHYVAHAEFLGDLLQMDRLALVDEGGIARDHKKPAQLGQCRDYVLANAVGKIILFGIAAHIDERQHRDRRPLRRRKGGPGRLNRQGRRLIA